MGKLATYFLLPGCDLLILTIATLQIDPHTLDLRFGFCNQPCVLFVLCFQVCAPHFGFGESHGLLDEVTERGFSGIGIFCF